MADGLPLGQIQPASRPVGGFIQPGRVDTQSAAAPQALPEPKSIESLRTAAVGDVNTKGEYAQIAEALGPFLGASSKLAEVFIKKKAIDDIDSGYYAAMANQQQRASLLLQRQKEVGAEKAADVTTKLEKVDQVGADLLRNVNSFRSVGARRALAQLAASEIDNEFEKDLVMDAGSLAGITPGSSLLTERKHNLAQKVYGKYGLTGEESESAYYVTPALNKAWDKYTEKHLTLYNEGLKATTIVQGAAALGQAMQDYGEKGINGYDLALKLKAARYDVTGIPEGVIRAGDGQFANLVGMALTLELDQQLAMLGGRDRADALKAIREQLAGTYGQVPVMGEVLSLVRGGPAKAVVKGLDGREMETQVEMGKRPVWGASNTLDLLELANRGNGARVQKYELEQKSVGQQLDALWWDKSQGGPGSMLPTDPGYPAALITFRSRAAQMGYRDVDGYMKGRMDSQSSVTSQAYARDPLASQDFINQVNDMPPSAFSSPEGIERIREQARQAARSEPTRELQAAKYQEYTKAIEARKKAAEDFTPGVKQDIDRALLQDIGLPAVKALVDKAAKKGGGGLFQSMIQSGADPASAAASALGGSAVAAFTTRVQNLYLRNVEATINDWREKNPGRALVPASKNVLISQAIAETRQSKEYAQAYTELTGRKPGEAGPGKVGTSVGPREAGPAQTPNGYPKRSAAGIPDREVRDYQQRALMTGDWLRSEVEAINDGKPVSPETYNLAKRAGTSVNRLLLEQLKLYPELDSGGGAQKYLQEQVRRQRQGQTVSSANYQGAVNQDRAAAPYNPLAPGSWLMNMLMPPAAAATLPPGYARFQGGGGGGGPIDPGQWASGPAVRGSNAETGGGYTIPGMKDAQGRPPVFSQGGANSFAAMVRDSGGQVKAGDIASSQRSAGKNRAVGGAEGSHHLEGNAMDIHGSSIDWIRKNGARYGWHVNDYPGSHGGHVEFRGGGTASPQASTRKGGGMTGLATYYNGSGGSDGVAGGPTANGEKYNPSAMTAAVQWSLRDKYLNKWVQVEDLNTGKRVRVWVNDVGQMGGSEKSVNQADPRMIDLSPAAFTKLFGSTSRGVGRIRIVEG